MTARIIKVQSNKTTWFEVQIRFLWIFWLDANIVKPGFSSVYLDLEDAMSSLDKLKKPKLKKTVQCVVKF